MIENELNQHYPFELYKPGAKLSWENLGFGGLEELFINYSDAISNIIDKHI